MPAAISTSFRVSNALSFIQNMVSNPTYLGVGNILPWEPSDAFPYASDTIPPIPEFSFSELENIRRAMIGAKRIMPSNVSLAIPRYNWTTGTVYTQYDYKDRDTVDKNTYVMINDSGSADYLNVYKCISNNRGGNSTSAPSGTSNSIIGPLADGYKWKFMYKIDSTAFGLFATSTYLPISKAQIGSLQAGVNATAIPGTIDTIVVTTGGSGYTSATVHVDGDGTGCSAVAVISSGAIVGINITSNGQDYTYANVTIAGTGTGCIAYANISPPGGHGSNTLAELGGYYVAFSQTLQNNESGTVATSCAIRTLSLFRNANGISGDPFTSTNARLSTILNTGVPAGIYDITEKVFSSSGATGYVVDRSSGSGSSFLNVTQVEGTFLPGDTITGGTSGAISTVTSILPPDMIFGTEDIFYTEYIQPVSRGPSQTEAYKIVTQW